MKGTEIFLEKTLGPSLEEVGESERSRERESCEEHSPGRAQERGHGLGTVLGPPGVGQKMTPRTRDGKFWKGQDGPDMNSLK